MTETTETTESPIDSGVQSLRYAIADETEEEVSGRGLLLLLLRGRRFGERGS